MTLNCLHRVIALHPGTIITLAVEASMLKQRKTTITRSLSLSLSLIMTSLVNRRRSFFVITCRISSQSLDFECGSGEETQSWLISLVRGLSKCPSTHAQGHEIAIPPHLHVFRLHRWCWCFRTRLAVWLTHATYRSK